VGVVTPVIHEKGGNILDALWWILVFILFFLAYAGLIFPVLPDSPFLLAGFALYHFMIDSSKLGSAFWITVILLTLLLFFVDHLSSVIAVKKYGGTGWSIAASVAGIVIFPLILGPIGIIVGPFVLVLLLEWVLKKSLGEAFKVAFGTLVGFVGGALVKFFVMTGLLVWFFILVWMH
jgi:uncharacterized protein YqgC (DUF456 family)